MNKRLAIVIVVIIALAMLACAGTWGMNCYSTLDGCNATAQFWLDVTAAVAAASAMPTSTPIP